MQTNKKRKLKTYNKCYNLNQSPLYKLSSQKELCRLLNVSKNEIQELIDSENLSKHYDCFLIENRLIRHPISKMYEIHHVIGSLLARIETPEYLHSKKKSSYITNASFHSDSRQVITFDISSFFSSITSNTVKIFFRNKMKCSPDVAYILSELCSVESALPTGSAVSFYLSFLANIDMFEEMSILAKANNTNFTLYVDDITLSGKHVDKSLFNTMKKIVEKYGYLIKSNKTKRYTYNDTPIITGLAVSNGKVNSVNKFMYKLRKKNEFLSGDIQNLDNKLLLKEYNSLRGKNTYLRSLGSLVPSHSLEMEEKLRNIVSVQS